MSDSEIITATEASRAFSDLLHRVSYKGESFIIKKGHRLMARIVPVEEEALPAAARKTSKPKAAAKRETAPPPEQKNLPQKPETVAAPAGLSVPENFTQDDVDFYQGLIATMKSR
jgi:antitoxin (DNA-binding transcriptional repressor) of toxin-antitoxin stability system